MRVGADIRVRRFAMQSKTPLGSNIHSFLTGRQGDANFKL
jgi:hypothetical protein